MKIIFHNDILRTFTYALLQLIMAASSGESQSIHEFSKKIRDLLKTIARAFPEYVQFDAMLTQYRREVYGNVDVEENLMLLWHEEMQAFYGDVRNNDLGSLVEYMTNDTKYPEIRNLPIKEVYTSLVDRGDFSSIEIIRVELVAINTFAGVRATFSTRVYQNLERITQRLSKKAASGILPTGCVTEITSIGKELLSGLTPQEGLQFWKALPEMLNVIGRDQIQGVVDQTKDAAAEGSNFGLDTVRAVLTETISGEGSLHTMVTHTLEESIQANDEAVANARLADQLNPFNDMFSPKKPMDPEEKHE